MTGPWQATAVAIGGRALLIEGAPGTGKSSLALALIDRGATLIGDDGVLFAAEGARLLASPAPATRGLIEVRGVGLLPMPVAERVPVALLITLAEGGPRYVEEAATATRGGIALPALTLWPGAATLALRAELALAHRGLA